MDPEKLRELSAKEKALSEASDWKGLEKFYRGEIRALAAGSTHEPHEDQLWRQLGWIYRFKLVDLDAALTCYELLCKRSPSVDDWTALATLYEGLKRDHEAIVTFEQLLTDYPDHGRAFDQLFRLHTAAANNDAAWRAAAARLALGGGMDMMKDFYTEVAPRKLPVPTGQLTVAQWESVIHPAAAIPVRRILRVSQRVIEVTRPASAGARDFVEALPEFRLAELGAVPLKVLVLASILECGRSYPVEEERKAEVEALRPKLAGVDKAELDAAVTHFFDHGAKANMTTWQSGAALSLRRAELLYAGDPVRCSPKPGPDALAYFASSACGRARKSLRIALPNSA